ncbi:MAG: HEAT repeat domain-containing protein [Lachnospiraceae bacterium]|nr:HEAT repeat domain-containing protein [Lachnospiraceae bacterium]MBQ9512212.1 HEAT repeat domain-containing protein [Lachnospiraceae bacterium]
MSKKFEKLEKLAAKGKGSAIVRFIKSKDPEVVKDAIAALGKCGGEDAINALTGLSNSSIKDLRIAAINALGKCGGSYNTTLFSHDLSTEKDPEVLEAIKSALGEIRTRIKTE